jgi:hypothetical protein
MSVASDGPQSSVRSVQDYWEGYKLFVMAITRIRRDMRPNFAIQNWVSDFPASLDFRVFWLSTTHLLPRSVWVLRVLTFTQQHAGQIVWRRLLRTQAQSPHSIRSTCMQLLPLVEMYCRWELQEDCGDLEALMLCFDSVSELESHDLGRSLLSMVRDEDDGLRTYSERRHVQDSLNIGADPFDAIRARLAAVDLAFQGLQPQVHIVVGDTEKMDVPSKKALIFNVHFGLCHSCNVSTLGLRHFCTQFLIQHRMCSILRICLCADSLRVPCWHLCCLPFVSCVGSVCACV